MKKIITGVLGVIVNFSFGSLLLAFVIRDMRDGRADIAAIRVLLPLALVGFVAWDQRRWRRWRKAMELRPPPVMMEKTTSLERERLE